MTPSEINEVANWIALFAIIPFALATLTYGLLAPWYKSLLGVSMFGLFASITIVLSVVLARRWFHEYPGYEWVAIVAYTLLVISGLAIFSVLVVELGRAGVLQIQLRRKAHR